MSESESTITQLHQAPRIPLDKIRESAVSLRIDYDDESLDELSRSQETEGELQPIIVQPGEGDWFDLVFGYRRVRAAKRRGDADIFGFVMDRRTPKQLLLMALAENLQRQDLNAFEEAQAFLRLMKEFDMDQKSIAATIHKNAGYVHDRVVLLSMPEDVQALVAQQKLTVRHMSPLARMPTGEQQIAMATHAVTNRLNADELRVEVMRELREPSPITQRNSREFTPTKLRMRIERFSTFLKSAPSRLDVRRMNATDKQALQKALRELDGMVQGMWAAMNIVEAPRRVPTGPTRVHATPRNHRETWPAAHIARIHALDRPSDEDLAVELGREVGAIRAKRHETKEPKRSA